MGREPTFLRIPKPGIPLLRICTEKSMILSLVNQKGGVGKTTLAAHLARAASLDGRRVLLVDSDRQGSLRDWHAAGDGGGIDLIAADTPSAIASIRHVAGSYDLVVVDGSPSANGSAIATIKVADVVLIPVQPSPLDLWAAHDLIAAVRDRQDLADGHPRGAMLISRAIVRSVLERDLQAALARVQLSTLEARTHQRVIYAAAMSSGLTAFEIDGGGPAAKEIRCIWREIQSWQ